MNYTRTIYKYRVYINHDLDEGYFSTVSGINHCTEHAKTVEKCFEKTAQFIREYLKKGKPANEDYI